MTQIIKSCMLLLQVSTSFSLGLAISLLPTITSVFAADVDAFKQTSKFNNQALVSQKYSLAQASVANLSRLEVKLAQQPATTGQNPSNQRAYAQGQQLLNEAQQLYQQGSAQSRQQAIAKYQEALKIWQNIGARSEAAITLLSIGTLQYVQNEPRKALEAFNSGLAIQRELKDRYGEAILLGSIGGVYADLGEKQLSLDFLNQALQIFRAEGKRSDQASMLIRIGNTYVNFGETQKALDSYNAALLIRRAEKDRAEEASTLNTIGRTYFSLGEGKKSLDAYNAALAIQRELGDRAGQANTLSSIGSLYNSLGENQKSIDFLNQALTLQRAAQSSLSGTALAFSRSSQALTLVSIAGTYSTTGDYQQALKSFNSAIELMRAAGNPHAEAEILNQVSYVYDQLGERQKALDSLNKALTIQRKIGNRSREAFTLNNIGGIYNSLGEPQKALDTHNAALEIQQQIKDRAGEAETFNEIAEVYRTLGDYKSSIDSYTSGLSIYRAVGNRTEEAQTLDDIGGVYRLAKDDRKALEYFNQSLAVSRANKNYIQQVSSLTSLARTYEALKDYPKALDVANQILSVSRSQKISVGEAAAFAQMGRIYRASGDYQKSVDSSTQALTLFQKLGFRDGEANVLENLGDAYDSLKQPQQAIETYNKALALRRTLGDASGEAQSLLSIAKIERDRNNLEIAQKQIEASLKIVESLRSKVTSQDLRSSYFASVQGYYDFYVDLLMRRHKQQPKAGYDAKALQASERARARSLVELLTEANVDIRQGVAPALLERERSLKQQIDAKTEQQVQLLNSSQSSQQAAALKQEVDALNSQYQQVQVQIRQSSPRYAALTQPQPLQLKQIQQLLDRDTVLLEYSLGEDSSYLWAVTPTSISSYQLPSQDKIEKLSRRYYQLLTDRRYGYVKQELNKVGAELSQLLLAPVAKQLNQKRLVVVSEGALQYVPFGALPEPGTTARNNQPVPPLLVKHEVVSLPSASTLAVVRHDLKGRKPAPKTVAVFADPVFGISDERVRSHIPSKQPVTDNLLLASIQRSASNVGIATANESLSRLPGTRQEAEGILALVPSSQSKQAFGFAANRATANSPDLSQYRMIHFGTHGLLNSENPQLSGIVLSLVDPQGKPQDGFLGLTQVYNLKLPAELVVLSACQTGLGQNIQGEGLVGLTRGFMYAGTPRVVASMWSVDDAATAELMQRFYQGMLKQNRTPAAALRAAQVEMWQQQKWRSPYYWAAFVMQGEWR